MNVTNRHRTDRRTVRADRRRSGTSPALSAVLAACAVGLLVAGSLAADKDDANVDDTRAALEKWVETQRIISRERRDLELAKEMLNERIDLLQREIRSLRDRTAEAAEDIAEAEKKRREMAEENDKLKAVSSVLAEKVTVMEARTRRLLKRLPAPIRDRVKPLSQRIPEKPDETELSVGERFQNVIGILNEVNKFHGEITLASEVRTLPDGTSAEVTAMYLGIGHGYYAGANGKIAGVGRSGPDAWVWTPANDAAEQIADAIAILQNEKVAAFVQVPVNIE